MSDASAAILVAERISKRFADPDGGGEVLALRDITVAVRRHEFLSVIGPSGCGKSTFLRIVAGLDRPSSGEITVDGRRVKGPGADRGMVFQEYALLPWKTTLQNVAFGPQLKGVPKREREAAARRFIELVGLGGFEQRYPHQLSGGMRQRAAVARALANQPAVLLMDEPFAAVDAMTRQRLQEELTQISQTERMTVLFVTHAIEEAIFLSDRVVVLSGRPGTVIRELTVDFPRPRSWETLINDAGFIALRDKLLALLLGNEPAALAGATGHA
jgi:NitT/TauT family transport system ATP-binding protein